MEFENSVDFYNWLNSKEIDACSFGPEFEAYARMQRFLLDKSICNCKKKNKTIDSYYENLNKMSDENQRKLLEALAVESILLKKESNIVAELRTQVLEKS